MPKLSKSYNHKASQKKKRQDRFILAFQMTASISSACAKSGIDRSLFYDWKKNDLEFLTRFEDLDMALTDKLESKAVDLAMDGETPVLMFLLRARLPGKYREKQEISIEGAVPLSITFSNDKGVLVASAPSLSNAGTSSLAV